MPAVIIKHRVADYTTWLEAFEAHGPVREQAGIGHAIVWQEEGDPNSVVILFKVDDLSAARGFASNPDLKTAMEAAGVTETPTFTFLDGGKKFEH